MFCKNCGNTISDEANFCNKCGDQLNAGKYPASIGKRLFHGIVDYVGIIVFGVILVLFLSLLGFDTDNANDTALGATMIIGYYFFFEGIWHTTPAKLITGTKVVRKGGGRLKFSQIVGRTFSRFIPFEAFSFLVSNNPVGWHDRISSTLVVPKSFTEEDVKTIGVKKSKPNIILIIIIIFATFALVGILASVVLASLNAARQKGIDASIKAQLSAVMVDAEIFWTENGTTDTPGSYAGVCNEPKIIGAINAVSVYTERPLCNDAEESYAISGVLKNGNYFCVDSSGVAEEVTQSIGYTETQCPIF